MVRSSLKAGQRTSSSAGAATLVYRASIVLLQRLKHRFDLKRREASIPFFSKNGAYMDALLLHGIFSAVQTRKVAVLYPAWYAASPLAPMKSADPRLILCTGC